MSRLIAGRGSRKDCPLTLTPTHPPCSGAAGPRFCTPSHRANTVIRVKARGSRLDSRARRTVTDSKALPRETSVGRPSVRPSDGGMTCAAHGHMGIWLPAHVVDHDPTSYGIGLAESVSLARCAMRWRLFGALSVPTVLGRSVGWLVILGTFSGILGHSRDIFFHSRAW